MFELRNYKAYRFQIQLRNNKSPVNKEQKVEMLMLEQPFLHHNGPILFNTMGEKSPPSQCLSAASFLEVTLCISWL